MSFKVGLDLSFLEVHKYWSKFLNPQGKVSNLADQGLKGGSKFEEAAAKLSGNSTQQFQASTELDKQLQKEDDFKRAAQLKAVSNAQDLLKLTPAIHLLVSFQLDQSNTFWVRNRHTTKVLV